MHEQYTLWWLQLVVTFLTIISALKTIDVRSTPQNPTLTLTAELLQTVGVPFRHHDVPLLRVTDPLLTGSA